MRKLYRLVGFFILLLSAGTASAGNSLHYEATLEDSVWEVSSSPLRCTLTHPVKFFGKAQFYQLAGFQPKFRFYVDQIPVKKGTVELNSVAPQWKHGENVRDLGSYSYARGETPFRFKREMSLRLLAELEQGLRPVFLFKDWGDGHDDVSAVLSTVRFRDGLVKYRTCMGKLIPYDFNKVKNTRVHFDTAKYNLSAKARRQLDAVIAFLLRDPSVKTAYVDGHTDSRGTHAYNNTLSEQRATAVRNYLLERKVPASKLKVKYFGKRKPLKTNRTKKGRAVNRRVWVELVRE